MFECIHYERCIVKYINDQNKVITTWKCRYNELTITFEDKPYTFLILACSQNIAIYFKTNDNYNIYYDGDINIYIYNSNNFHCAKFKNKQDELVIDWVTTKPTCNIPNIIDTDCTKLSGFIKVLFSFLQKIDYNGPIYLYDIVQ